jgi:DNA polymerase-3 subunit epsilon
MPTPLAEVAAAGLALDRPPPAALVRPLLAALLGADANGLEDPVEYAALIAAARPVPDAKADSRSIPLHEADFLIVDLETTGGPGTDSTILEIGAVRLSGGSIVDRFQTLVDPVTPIPPFIQTLTGIHDGMLVGAPRLGAAMAAFEQWMARVPEAPFIAHNAPFDEGFVRRALALCGLPPLVRPVLCTRRLARRLMPEMHRFGLDALCERFTIENHARHRALGDADATAELLLILLARARDRLGLHSVPELIALNAASTRAVARQTRAHATPCFEPPPAAVAAPAGPGFHPGRFLPASPSD